MLPNNNEIENRKKVWLALSDLFLDTDVSLSYEYIARICSESEYSLNELKEILDNEVAPVCSGNLLSVAGEWAGFDEEWLINNILERTYNKHKHIKLGRFLKLLKNFGFRKYINTHWGAIAVQIENKRNNAQ